MAGLNAASQSSPLIIADIFTVALADAFADALGIRVSEEAKVATSARDILKATMGSLAGKLVFELSFIVPVLLLDVTPAIIVSIV
jgi:hypothetical protein